MTIIDLVIPFFNCIEDTLATLASVNSQEALGSQQIQIHIVDDGSDDWQARRLSQAIPDHVRVIRLPTNRGRAAARNAGAAAATGDILVFIDSDCAFADSECLSRQVSKIRSGLDVCFCQLKARGEDFWAQYQRELAIRRMQRATNGDFLGMTSACFAIRREIFEHVGRFDERYVRYGFEDRDLVARLMKASMHIGVADDVVVWHDAKLTLEAIARKAEEAGRFTSGLFMSDHPQEYVRMSQSLADVRLHPWRLGLLSMLTWALMPISVRLGERIINSSTVPFALKAFIVKVTSGLAYLRGTRAARKDPLLP